MKRTILFTIKRFFCSFIMWATVSVVTGFAENAQMLVPADHWVYGALHDIFSGAGNVAFVQSAPLSAAEITVYLNTLDYDSLSAYGRMQYDRVRAYLERNVMQLSSGVVSAGVGLALTPELYYKTNSNIDWSFPYYFKDNFLTLPVYLSVGKKAFVESDVFLGRNYWSVQAPENFHNLPFNLSSSFFTGFEFDWPKNAYISLGTNVGDTACFNFQIGRGGLSIGQTQTGSVILSPQFETDGYVRFSFFSPDIKYTMDTIQVAVNKYLYLHRIEFRFFKKLQFSLMEGAYINAPFELRFLNPLMIMHSFGFWNSYPDTGINNCCAYLTFTFDYVPVKNVRIYGLYAQNELRAPNETDLRYPNSMGFQLGAETTIPAAAGAFHCGLEAVYTMPWLYIKHTPDSSLFHDTYDHLYETNRPINSWIGTPFGPDSIAVCTKIGYEIPQKWSASMSFLWLAQGENAFADKVFFKSDGTRKDPDKNPSDPDDLYYPPTLSDEDEAERRAAKIAPSGIPQYTNRISIEGSYYISDRFSLSARISYAVILNDGNLRGQTEHGVECALSGTYRFF